MVDLQVIEYLFQTDDGSLPDIFIENLTPEEVENIHKWILEITHMLGNIPVWNIKDEKGVEIPLKDAAKTFNNGEIEPFRHELKNLVINNVPLPDLTVALELKGEISFDYRMGEQWRNKEIKALLEFLRKIKNMAPSAIINQADEGCYDKPNKEFSRVFEAFCKEVEIS